jgi:hypothetical protein
MVQESTTYKYISEMGILVGRIFSGALTVTSSLFIAAGVLLAGLLFVRRVAKIALNLSISKPERFVGRIRLGGMGSGPLTTAGNLLFAGDTSGHILTIDSTTALAHWNQVRRHLKFGRDILRVKSPSSEPGN